MPEWLRFWSISLCCPPEPGEVGFARSGVRGGRGVKVSSSIDLSQKKMRGGLLCSYIFGIITVYYATVQVQHHVTCLKGLTCPRSLQEQRFASRRCGGERECFKNCENRLSLIGGHEGEAGLRQVENSLVEVQIVAGRQAVLDVLVLISVIVEGRERMFYKCFQLSFTILEAILLIFSALEEGALFSVLFHYQFSGGQFDSYFFS